MAMFETYFLLICFCECSVKTRLVNAPSSGHSLRLPISATSARVAANTRCISCVRNVEGTRVDPDSGFAQQIYSSWAEHHVSGPRTYCNRDAQLSISLLGSYLRSCFLFVSHFFNDISTGMEKSTKNKFREVLTKLIFC